jgi:signal transduction histidine kinase
MHYFASFFERNIVLIYFLYGLAFYSLGLAVLLESQKATQMPFVRALRPLTAFSFMHGVHEWGEMFQKILELTQGYRLSVNEEVLRLVWLAGSFCALIVFGMMLIVQNQGPPGQGFRLPWATVWLVPVLLGLLWLAAVPALRAAADSTEAWLAMADVWARYTLGIPAGLLAAWGLVRQQHVFRQQGLARFGRDCLWAAVAFGWYGLVGQIFTRPSALFPSNMLNSELFLHLFGFPVELLRALMGTLAAVFIIRSLRAFEVERGRRLQELQEAQLREVERREALRSDLLRRIVTAQEAERQRIARELHDETGQALTALGLGLRSLQSSVRADPALAERRAAELETLASRSLDELRRLVADLRPSQLDDLGLVAALRWYAQEVEARTGLRVRFEVEGHRAAVPPELATVLFRIAQEALTNVVKHGRATGAVVSLCFEPAGTVRLTVADDGRGFDPERVLASESGRAAWGLLGIQERATLAGGQATVRASPGHGTIVSVVVPLEAGSDGQDQALAG